MVQNITGLGSKHNLEPNRENKAVQHKPTYGAPDLKFLAKVPSFNEVSVHNNFGDFLVNSSDIFQKSAFLGVKENAKLQPYEGYVDNKTFKEDAQSFRAQPQGDIKNIEYIRQQVLEKVSSGFENVQHQPVAEHVVPHFQKIPLQENKGYGAKLMHDPIIAVLPKDSLSFGYVNGLKTDLYEESDSDYIEHGLFKDNASKKNVGVSKNQEASSVFVKLDEIESLKKITQELQKQLQKSHPFISVPIEHPDGVVDVNLRFSSNGNVRALFAGSNAEVVQLMAQNKDKFIKTITDEGYSIDERHIGFINQPQENNVRI